METHNLEGEVLDLLAHERGLPREKIQLSNRLLQDLGMDGDDAVDFFISIHERFGTDLTHLQEHWSEHFGPEGFSLWNCLVIIPVVIIGGLVTFFFAHLLGRWSILCGIAATAALLAAWLWGMRRWGPKDRFVPVTVAEVLAAVELGSWPSPRET